MNLEKKIATLRNQALCLQIISLELRQQAEAAAQVPASDLAGSIFASSQAASNAAFEKQRQAEYLECRQMDCPSMPLGGIKS